MRDIIIGTAGHIDHGKTTLLKAMTGIDADRLQEERRRGISIDIGFAHMSLGSYRIGFVDVPGHEKFVKNMLAGIGGIQLVLLVVAADESVMPQTVEHFQICRLLKIPRAIVVITKTALVEEDLVSVVREEIGELLTGTQFENSPIVTVDSVSGDGLDSLRETLLGEVEQLDRSLDATRDTKQVFRLPIDRVFTIRGFGTVITGTPYTGTLKRGATVAIHPTGKSAKVRGIEIFNQSSDLALAGQRTALNLSGVEKEELQRGMVVSEMNAFRASHMFDVIVDLLPHAPQSLKHRAAVRFHHGSAELIGRIHLLEGDTMRPGKRALAQLRLDKPTVCSPGDRFVLRRYSPITTIGGGIVLDGLPEKHRKKDLPAILPGLKRLASMWEREKPEKDRVLMEYFIKLGGASGLTLPEAVSRTGFTSDYLTNLLSSTASIIVVPQEPLLAVSRPALEELKEKIVQFLSQFHERNPLATGISREELKEKFLRNANNAYFQFLLSLLQSERKISVSGGSVSLHGRRIQLSSKEETIKTKILQSFSENPLQPPTLKELTDRLPHDSSDVQSVFYFLLEQGDLVKINEDMVLPPDQISRLESQLKESFGSGETFAVSEFKDLFQISRKYAIPFLEFLDRQRITRRRGDRRVVL